MSTQPATAEDQGKLVSAYSQREAGFRAEGEEDLLLLYQYDTNPPWKGHCAWFEFEQLMMSASCSDFGKTHNPSFAMNSLIELKVGPLHKDRDVSRAHPGGMPLPEHGHQGVSTTAGEWAQTNPRIRCRNVEVSYGDKKALHDVNLDIGRHEVIAFIGPSGCGKSTFLRCLNRMNDMIVGCRISGQIMLDGQDIYDNGLDAVPLRAKVGMVFQKPNPFPKSIFENVAYGPRIHGMVANKGEEAAVVEMSLRRAGLWEEVKDYLDHPGTSLSGGQQQRLCIARTLAVNPEVILMDEPCSALDPIATAKIEQLIDGLSEQYTIVIVTHSMQQAARVSARTAYFHLGKLIEVGDTAKVFTNPLHPLTNDYISGRFG